MKKTLTTAAIIALGFSLPAVAADSTTKSNTKSGIVAGHSDELTVHANSEQVRKLLMSQGYSNVSHLRPDANGRWSGVAMKDGKPRAVAVSLPAKSSTAIN
ncbi:MAG: hypothetical protein RIC14_00590 [Filomicrobium sp.]